MDAINLGLTTLWLLMTGLPIFLPVFSLFKLKQSLRTLRLGG